MQLAPIVGWMVGTACSVTLPLMEPAPRCAATLLAALWWNFPVDFDFGSGCNRWLKMLCPNCHASITAQAQICPRCGSDLGNLPQQRSLLRTIATSIIDATPAAELIRRVLGRENIYSGRKRLARKYLRGTGIEFGALNAPLDLPRGAKVIYADVEEAKSNYKIAATPDIVADIETMKGIEDCSVDFIIANHVLEHLENPLRALQTIHRVLRSSGIAFIALPDKRFTFDRKRPTTSLDHIIADYKCGPKLSLRSHYEDWASNALGLEGDEHRKMVVNFLERHQNIHFHVWDYAAMTEMFNHAASSFGFSIVHSRLNGSEVIWILQAANRRGSIAN